MKKILSVLILGVMLMAGFGMVSAVTPTTLFSDGFESGNFNNWDEHNNDWKITIFGEHSGTYAAFVTDQGSSYDDLRREISTIGYNNIVFSYWYKIAESIGSSEHVYVHWYDGSTWHQLADYTNVNSGSWTSATFNLPSGAINNPDFEIRFRASDLDWSLHGDKDVFMLDDVVVTGNALEQECSDCVLDIINPLTGEYYSGSEILIDWTAEGNDCMTYSVWYGTWNGNSCDFTDIPSIVSYLEWTTQYSWIISGLAEGQYCVKVKGACCEDAVEGPFCIDQTAPDVGICVDGCCQAEGIESDSWTSDTQTVIEIEYSDPDNNCGDECILSCEINWGDGISQSCESACDEWGCYHQYADNGNYNVLVSVTDCAENTGTDEKIVHVENVAPTCEGIDAPSDVAVGQLVTFTGYGSDVNADLPLIYNWNFGDEATADNENPTTHTYTVAGEYTVLLTVEDKDGGISEPCTHEIDVVEPVVLSDQEVAAYYPLIADFGDDGEMRSFDTGLTDTIECNLVQGPSNMRTKENLDYQNSCRVRWDNDKPPYGGLTENPTNDEQGSHYVLIRVENSEGDYEYFTFNVMVYSWIIDLQEGWNLVSIPYVPEDTGISADGIGIVQIKDELSSIWSYEYDAVSDSSSWKCKKTTSSGAWSSSYCSGTDTKLDDIVPGRGYWLKMDEPAQLKGFGTQISQTGSFPGMPPEIEVPTNSWSLIGRYGILGKEDFHYPGETSWDAGAIFKSKALESLTKLDNELHVFEVDEDVHLNEVHKLWNNEGYWLWIEDEAFNNAVSESYAPLDKYYMEDLYGCGKGCHLN